MTASIENGGPDPLEDLLLSTYGCQIMVVFYVVKGSSSEYGNVLTGPPHCLKTGNSLTDVMNVGVMNVGKCNGLEALQLVPREAMELNRYFVGSTKKKPSRLEGFQIRFSPSRTETEWVWHRGRSQCDRCSAYQAAFLTGVSFSRTLSTASSTWS